MSKNILITGASGFIGSCMVEKAIEKGYKTFAVIRKSSSKQYLQNPLINFIEIDFDSNENLDKVLQNFLQQEGKIDYIIHGAGLTKAYKNDDYYTVNYGNTKNFVEALQRNNAVPSKFLFVSSLAAYGSSPNEKPIDETFNQNPLTHYGKSKQQAEDYLRSTKNFPYIIVNPTAVYGPRDKDFYFLLKSLASGVEMYINNKKQLLSFVHVSDLVDAIYIALESNELYKNFIVSDLENYVSKDFNAKVAKQLNKKTFAIVLPANVVYVFALVTETIGKLKNQIPILNRERLKEFKAKNWSVNANAIKQLGFKPNFTLEQGLQNAIDWYKKNGWLK